MKKRVLYLALVSVLGMGFTSCSKDDSGNFDHESDNPGQETDNPEVPGEFVFGDGSGAIDVSKLGEIIKVALPVKEYKELGVKITSDEEATTKKVSGSSCGWEYEWEEKDGVVSINITKRSSDPLVRLEVTLLDKDGKEYSASCVLKNHIPTLNRVHPLSLGFGRGAVKKMVFKVNVSEDSLKNYSITGFSDGIPNIRGEYDKDDSTLTIVTNVEMFVLPENCEFFFSSYNYYYSDSKEEKEYPYHRMTEIVGMEYLNTEKVTSMKGMFCLCVPLVSLDLSSFNTEKVTDMKEMFYRCASLKSLNLSSFNTEKVTDMNNMFNCCASLKSLNLSSFNTEKVTNMEGMFCQCDSLNSLNLSSFNTEKVTDMKEMFYRCTSLKSLNLSSFNTEKVTDMEFMFAFCDTLKSLNLSSFNTEKVTNMKGMFNGCSFLESLDLPKLGFKTDSVTNMSYMFRGCALTELDLSSFNTEKVTDMDNMFWCCSKLKSLKLSDNFVIGNTTNVSNMFESCGPSQTDKGVIYGASGSFKTAMSGSIGNMKFKEE